MRCVECPVRAQLVRPYSRPILRRGTGPLDRLALPLTGDAHLVNVVQISTVDQDRRALDAVYGFRFAFSERTNRDRERKVHVLTYKKNFATKGRRTARGGFLQIEFLELVLEVDILCALAALGSEGKEFGNRILQQSSLSRHWARDYEKAFNDAITQTLSHSE